jgi:hypothetical protein
MDGGDTARRSSSSGPANVSTTRFLLCNWSYPCFGNTLQAVMEIYAACNRYGYASYGVRPALLPVAGRMLSCPWMGRLDEMLMQ